MADNFTEPQPRAPRTHTSPNVIRLLKTLSLPNILQKNQQIEAANEARAIKTLNNALDPDAHPEPGSETASLITLDTEDLNRLRIPSFFFSVREYIYATLAKYLADEELKEKNELKKRKGDETGKVSPEELRLSKRRCMDGADQVERIVGEPVPIEFAQSLYDTEACVAVPLPFFLSRNLRTLIDEASTLPTVKSNPLPGETKGIYILDVNKLSLRFGKELSLTCSQWSEAASNMWNFQVSRDKLGSEGEHALWFEKHFNFFNTALKRDDLYEAWKVMELEFRRDHRSRHLKFKAEDYDKAFSLNEESHKLRLEFRDMLASSEPTPHIFQSGNQIQKSVSPNSFCLICAEKDHTIFFHLKSLAQAQFSDGQAAWAKCSAGFGLVSPDNRPLCINWNVRGAEAALQCAGHGKEERIHLCSFCGSKDHYAFSWTCRKKGV